MSKNIESTNQRVEDTVTGLIGKIPLISKFDPLFVALIEAGLIVVATIIAVLFIKKILKKIYKKFARKLDHGGSVIVLSVTKPSILYIWVAGITFAVQVMNYELGTRILNFAESLRDITFIICVTWSVLRFINRYRRRYICRKIKIGKSVDLTTIDAIIKILKATTFITAGVVLMDKAGIGISGIMAFGGIGGIAVGFAAKDLLSNFFGAIMVYTDKPFVVGDWIKSPDRDIEGIVDSIGWRQTKIITFENYPVYIPNSVFSTIIVENKSRMKGRRIKMSIGLSYKDIGKIEKIVGQIKDMLDKHEGISRKFSTLVTFDKFDDCSLSILIYTFTKTKDWGKYLKVKQNVLLKVNKIIEKNGAKIAFPIPNFGSIRK